MGLRQPAQGSDSPCLLDARGGRGAAGASWPGRGRHPKVGHQARSGWGPYGPGTCRVWRLHTPAGPAAHLLLLGRPGHEFQEWAGGVRSRPEPCRLVLPGGSWQHQQALWWDPRPAPGGTGGLVPHGMMLSPRPRGSQAPGAAPLSATPSATSGGSTEPPASARCLEASAGAGDAVRVRDARSGGRWAGSGLHGLSVRRASSAQVRGRGCCPRVVSGEGGGGVPQGWGPPRHPARLLGVGAVGRDVPWGLPPSHQAWDPGGVGGGGSPRPAAPGQAVTSLGRSLALSSAPGSGLTLSSGGSGEVCSQGRAGGCAAGDGP